MDEVENIFDEAAVKIRKKLVGLVGRLDPFPWVQIGFKYAKYVHRKGRTQLKASENVYPIGVARYRKGLWVNFPMGGNEDTNPIIMLPSGLFYFKLGIFRESVEDPSLKAFPIWGSRRQNTEYYIQYGIAAEKAIQRISQRGARLLG